MKLNNSQEIQEFIKIVTACRCSVFLRSSEGEILDLMQPLSLYAGIGKLVSADGEGCELFANCREDEALLLGFFWKLEQARRMVPAA